MIQYRGYYGDQRDSGGYTALYPTEEEALRHAKACCFKGDTAWVNPEFVGLMETNLRALEPLNYIEWKPMVIRKVINTGECFVAGDIMVADHQVTRATIGLWIVSGKAEVVAQKPEPQTIGDGCEEVLESVSKS